MGIMLLILGQALANLAMVGGMFAVVGVPLRELRLKKDVLVSAVIHEGKSIIPGGSTVIRPGDHAVLVAAAGKIKTLDQALEERA